MTKKQLIARITNLEATLLESRKALERLHTRKDENIEKWARNLIKHNRTKEEAQQLLDSMIFPSDLINPKRRKRQYTKKSSRAKS